MMKTTLWPRSWNWRSFERRTVWPRWMSGLDGSNPALTRSGALVLKDFSSFARSDSSEMISTALRFSSFSCWLAFTGFAGGGLESFYAQCDLMGRRVHFDHARLDLGPDREVRGEVGR